MLQQYGQIEKLEFEPPMDYYEGDIKVFTYRPDARYRRKDNGETVVEDVKGTSNPRGWDPVFVLKKKLIEARYGIEILIISKR